MSGPPLAAITITDYTTLIFVVVGLVVFLAFAVASRPIARVAADQLRSRHVKGDTIVFVRRVVTFVVLGVGLVAALAFALESANVALFGIVLATIIASFGVQDVLKDYVSGYYVLLERHIRVGDRISLDTLSGTVTEVRLRVTLLKSETGDLIVVPNSELFGRSVIVHVKVEEAAKRESPK